MLFFGHIATSLMLADASDSDRAAAVAGNLLPDVLDKAGGWVFHVMPSARWLAHGLPFFAAACITARFFLDGPRWRGFVLGYAGHLICDLWNGGRVPWFAPFEKPDSRKEHWTPGRWGIYLIPEALGLPATLALLKRGSRPPAGGDG
jgi:hypothetical protein